jgi:F0F1-type ATP synthase beta subunit
MMDVSHGLEECSEEADYAILRAELNELGEARVRVRLVGLTLSEIRNKPGTEN